MEFTEPCYAALANVPLTIVFLNQTTTLSGKPVTLSFSIYPSPEVAYVEGIEMGGRAITALTKNRLFQGDDVISPGNIEYKVPPLPPGTYWMWGEGPPEMMDAWLIVE